MAATVFSCDMPVFAKQSSVAGTNCCMEFSWFVFMCHVAETK